MKRSDGLMERMVAALDGYQGHATYSWYISRVNHLLDGCWTDEQWLELLATYTNTAVHDTEATERVKELSAITNGVTSALHAIDVANYRIHYLAAVVLAEFYYEKAREYAAQH